MSHNSTIVFAGSLPIDMPTLTYFFYHGRISVSILNSALELSSAPVNPFTVDYGESSLWYSFGTVSEVFNGYERQYCELSANLSKKCSSVVALDGEQKKQKLSEIKSGLDNAEALIRKMDLEARSLPPSIKSSLLVKLREFKSDLSNFKTELKRITSGNLNASARDEVTGSWYG